MPSYREERDAVARVRNLRQSTDAERRKQALAREDDATEQQSNGGGQFSGSTSGAVVPTQQLPPISATYGDIMQLLGPTNYPAMLELFRGTSGLPDGVHPEVTVSFELFEAIQKRLVSTRDELEISKKELFVKAQQLSSVQNEFTRCSEKNTALARELKQSEEMCLELRKYTADVSILKQQHENEVISFKDEIAGMVSRLNFCEKQITDAHYKLSESMVQLAQKDAVIASLRRGAKTSQNSSLVGGADEGAAGTAADGDDNHNALSTSAAGSSPRRSVHAADRMFQEQLKQHITQLEKEKRLLESEVRDVLDMHEGYRSHVENVVREYEHQFMFYEDVVGSHQCADEFSVHYSPYKNSSSNNAAAYDDDDDDDADSWERISTQSVSEVKALLHMCEKGTNVMELVNNPTDECSFKLQVARCKDGAVSILQGSVEAVRLLEKLNTHMSTVVSIGELRDTWKRVQSQWTDHVRRLVATGVTALQFGLEGIQDKERVYKGNAMKEIEDKWVRVINSQYRLVMPTTTSETQTDGSPVGCQHQATQVGAGFFVGRVTVMTSTAPRAATENRPTQTEMQGTPSTSSLSMKMSVSSKEPLELDAAASSSTNNNNNANPTVTPAKVGALHSVIVQLAKVIRKLHHSTKPPLLVANAQAAAIVGGAVVDPLQYLKQLGQTLHGRWSDDILTLDVLLLKATLAMITEEADAATWLAAYQCHAELHRLERTVEAVGAQPPGRTLDTTVRADVANYPTLRRQLEDVVASIASQLDDGSIQKAVRVTLASDKAATVMTQAAVKDQDKKIKDLEAQLRIATAAAAAVRPSSHQSATRTPPTKGSSPPPGAALLGGSAMQKKSRSGDNSLKILSNASEISVKQRSPSSASSILPRPSREQSRNDEWDLEEGGGGDDSDSVGISIPTTTSSAAAPSVVTASGARRTPFKRTVEDAIVEHVRSVSPSTHLPSMQTKLEEAMSFGGDSRRGRGGKDDEPKWSSSNNNNNNNNNAAGGVSPSTAALAASGKKSQQAATTTAGPPPTITRSPSTLPLTSSEVPSSRSGKRGDETNASMPPLELNTRKHPPTNAPSKEVAKPRPPPQDRKGQPTKSKAELAIEEQYEQQQRLKMQQDAESGATGATGDLTTISMVTTSAISNNNSTSQKNQHQPATSPQHARPVMQVPARNSDGGFNAVDSTFFYRAPLPTSPTSDEDEASVSGSRAGSLTTSPRHRGAKNAASYFPDAKIRPLSPDFELVGMSRKETVAPSAMAGRKKGGAEGALSDGESSGPSHKNSQRTSPTESNNVSRRQTSPHNNSGSGGVTAAQIIEQARQQIKKNMQSEGPLSLGGSMITSSRTPAQQQQQHQLGPKQRAGARTTTTQPAPPTTSSAQEPTSQQQQQQQPRQLDGALRVLSPPVTAPAQAARRRPTLPGGSSTSRDQALAALDHPPLAPHSGTDFSSTLPLMAVGGGGRLLKPLTTMGVPVGASPTPFWASATPDQHVHGDDTPHNATAATTTAQQRWFPPYTSKDNEEDIEGVVGQSSAVQSPRTGGDGVGVKSEHEGAGGKRSRSITDGSPDAMMTLSDDNLNVNGFGRPTVNPKATVLAVGNPDTTDAKQRVHGFVPRRPNGADVMMDMIRKQRSESEVDVNNDSVLNLGVSGSGVHTNNSSNSPTQQQQRAQSPATSGSNGQTPRRSGAPPLGNVRRRESTGNTGGGGSDSSAASPPPSRGGGVGR